MGQQILTPEFGTTLVLVVEVAWGANPLGDPSLWTWTDITSDVMTQDTSAISLRRGGNDETSVAQPAECTFTLKNITGKYSQGTASVNYPNVRRNVPCRVRLILSGTSYTRFWGYVKSWTPAWNLNGKYAEVAVVADGMLQRYAQGSASEQSVMYRGISHLTVNPPIAYWPCEDLVNSNSFASGLVPAGQVMSITRQLVTFGSYQGFKASAALPVVNGSSWHGAIPDYVPLSTNQIQLQFFFSAPSSGSVNGTVIAELHTESPQPRWEILWGTGGTLTLKIFDYWGVLYNTFGPYSLNAGIGNTVVMLQLTQTVAVATVAFLLGVYNVDSLSAVTAGGSWVGGGTGPFLNKAKSIHMFPGGENTGMIAGHVVVQKQVDTTTTVLANYYTAYTGESPTARLARVAGENGEPLTVVGSSSVDMGPQNQASYLDILQDCANTEVGLLADGVNQGPTYYARESACSQPIALTLDLSKGQIADFIPVDDDQLIKNSFTANRPMGSSYVATDNTGPFGTSLIGTYAASATFNRAFDQEMADCAHWMLMKGTRFGPSDSMALRYPTVPVYLEKNPSLAAAVLTTDLLERLAITNVSSILTQQPNLRVDLQAQGYAETISVRQWHIAYNTTPWEVSNVALYAATTGDTGEFVGRLDSDGATLGASATQGASSLTVITPSGPLWTQAADDLPLIINVADIPVTVTAIGAPSATTVNSNITFESGISGWSVSGGTFAQSATHVHSGSWAGKVIPDGTSASDFIATDFVSISPGQVVSATAWVYFTSTVSGGGFVLNFVWTDSQGISVPAGNSRATFNPTGGVYTNVTITATAPGRTAQVAFAPQLLGTPPSSQVWWIDDVFVTVNTTQAFTVTGTTVTKALVAGAPIKLWNQAVVDM